LREKAYLVPAVATVIFVVAMFATRGDPFRYNLILGGFLAGAGYYVVYRLCGKQKPWWLLVGAMLTTVLVLRSPLLPLFGVIFRDLLPGDVQRTAPGSFVATFVRHFFGAGLMEELMKALPVLGAYWLGRSLRSPWRERVGIWEPLDGILVGTASAVGFTLFETLVDYVPGEIQRVGSRAGMGVGHLLGLQLLIPRIVGSLCGHMAYSGYLGYFIGLSILKPATRWHVLGVGYLSAAALHAFWNASSTVGPWMSVVVGSLSYAFLAAAILKARQISPTRSQNFATQVLGAAAPALSARFTLHLAGRALALYADTQVWEQDLPGLQAQAGNGVVAQVNHHPSDPTILGLRNLSRGSWTVTAAGNTRQVHPGQSVKLAARTTINFGPLHGDMRDSR